MSMEWDELDRVAGYLSGRFAADEDTLAAAAGLAVRLDRLRRSSELFAGVCFSPDIERLSSRAMTPVAG